jgi:hypothetical protein
MHKCWWLLLVIALPLPLHAQIKRSEKATVSQVINGTTISLEFYRPVARGRDSLFGSVVHWNETWTPGANWATTLETDKEIRLNGHVIPKGKYSIWMITARDSAWTFFLSKNARLFHTRRPRNTNDDLVRFRVTPGSAPHMEALMWYFPTIQRDSALLRMHWGTTVVDLRVHTQATERPVLSGEERAGYLGDFLLKYDGANDSSVVQVVAEGDRLVMSYTDKDPRNSYSGELIPRGRGVFAYGFRSKGEVVEVEEHPITFRFEDKRAVAFEITDAETGKVMARGRRTR